MSKRKHASIIRFAYYGLFAGLAGCAHFSQPAAPIESAIRPATVTGNAALRPAPTRTPSGGAVSTPLPPATPLRPDAPAGGGGRSGAANGTRESTHVVVPGETLFRIAHSNGLKYQDLANWNQLPGDYSIKVGQVLRLTPPDGASAAPSRAAPVVAESKPPERDTTTSGPLKSYPKALKLPYSAAAAKTLAAQSEGAMPAAPHPTEETKAPTASAAAANAEPAPKSDASAAAASPGGWLWPTQGKVLQGFSEANKGIDIAGKLGQPIVAVASGSVVYSGTGLRGYGKLIIIKHDKTFLTAYAHNSQILVKEGQAVKKGQKIAEMGNTDADKVMLHFEVRRFGKPVDPIQYLDKQS